MPGSEPPASCGDSSSTGLEELDVCRRYRLDTSKDLNANVVFSGGTTMFPRFGEGMAKEFTSSAHVHDENHGDGPTRAQVFEENLWICVVFPQCWSRSTRAEKTHRTHLLTYDGMLFVERSACSSHLLSQGRQ